MAASSPALSNNSTETPTKTTTSTSSAAAATAATATATATFTPPSSTNTSKNLRGLNKPKCIKCGNVARSRCPYQSCKSCCAKAQNPCHIHVLKGGSNIPDKVPSSGSPIFDQQSTDVPHSANSHRVASLRQLSNSFAQFNNLQSPVRSRKPLTRKDAQLINEWRFLKLKEFRDRNIEAENEAFDRYMRNVSLLEEVFSVNSAADEQNEDGSSIMNSDHSVDDSADMVIAGLKVKLRSNPVRIENFRKRLQYVVDQGLRKLNKFESNDGSNEVSDSDETGRKPKKFKSLRAERSSALSELIDKLNKARNEEDLKACKEMSSQLFEKSKPADQVESDIETTKDQTGKTDLSPKLQSNYSPQSWFRTRTIDQESLCRIDAHFCSLEDIEDL